MAKAQTIPQIYQNLGAVANHYGMALLATWRTAKSSAKNMGMIPFSKEDLVYHGDQIRALGITVRKLAVKNVPDIIYTYRARSDMPAEIQKVGNYAIVGRGKGLYYFAKISRPNRMQLPKTMTIARVPNSLPSWAQQFMSNDEQGMLTSMACNDLVMKHLGLRRAFRLQSHLRCGVPNYGQVEIDEVYVGEDSNGDHVIIGVEAKDRSGNDLLNVAQLYGSSQALQSLYPNQNHKVLGVKPDQNDNICICEFTVPKIPSGLRPVGQWVAYKLT